MVVEVNGERREVAEETTVAQLVAQTTERTRGVAVARGGEVVPQSEWEATRLSAGDRVEILEAVQGG